MVQITFINKTSIELKKVAFVLEYKSNFILLNQLQDNKIIYHDNLSSI